MTGAQRQLASTLEQKDLGVWITPDMSLILHCHKIASNINQVLGRPICNFTIHSYYSVQNFSSSTSPGVLHPNLEPSFSKR